MHVSELVDRRIGHPEEVVEEGDVVPLKIVRIEHDRHRLGLSLREARTEAMIRGWQFDLDGRTREMPEEAAKLFPDEAIALAPRFAARLERAAEESRKAAAAASARQESRAEDQQARAAMPDDQPVLTAMQAAMQQAQADLAQQQTDTEAPSEPSAD